MTDTLAKCLDQYDNMIDLWKELNGLEALQFLVGIYTDLTEKLDIIKTQMESNDLNEVYNLVYSHFSSGLAGRNRRELNKQGIEI